MIVISGERGREKMRGRETNLGHFDEPSTTVLFHIKVETFVLDLKHFRRQFLFTTTTWLWQLSSYKIDGNRLLQLVNEHNFKCQRRSFLKTEVHWKQWLPFSLDTTIRELSPVSDPFHTARRGREHFLTTWISSYPLSISFHSLSIRLSQSFPSPPLLADVVIQSVIHQSVRLQEWEN